MKERGLIFTGTSVRGILAGTKTQTRRLLRPTSTAKAPYGVAGDRVWAKETWARRSCVQHEGGLPEQPCTCRPVLFAADADPPPGARAGAWVSPMYLARRDARIVLELLSVRRERLQAITEEDARAEGIDPKAPIEATINGTPGIVHVFGPDAGRKAYAMMWDAIHARGDAAAKWSANPDVWVLSFRRLIPAAGAP